MLKNYMHSSLWLLIMTAQKAQDLYKLKDIEGPIFGSKAL